MGSDRLLEEGIYSIYHCLDHDLGAVAWWIDHDWTIVSQSRVESWMVERDLNIVASWTKGRFIKSGGTARTGVFASS